MLAIANLNIKRITKSLLFIYECFSMIAETHKTFLSVIPSVSGFNFLYTAF